MSRLYLTIILLSLSLIHLKPYYPKNKIRNLVSSNLKLNYEGLENKKGWEKAGVILPSYDVKNLAEKTKKNPVWVHFGIGNIFRFFIGGVADE